jgi:hypothetical protein
MLLHLLPIHLVNNVLAESIPSYVVLSAFYWNKDKGFNSDRIGPVEHFKPIPSQYSFVRFSASPERDSWRDGLGCAENEVW